MLQAVLWNAAAIYHAMGPIWSDWKLALQAVRQCPTLLRGLLKLVGGGVQEALVE